MTCIYIKKLELIDEYNNRIFSISGVSAETGLKRALNFIKIKDGDSTVKKIFKYLDEDLKILLGVENEQQ